VVRIYSSTENVTLRLTVRYYGNCNYKYYFYLFIIFYYFIRPTWYQNTSILLAKLFRCLYNNNIMVRKQGHQKWLVLSPSTEVARIPVSYLRNFDYGNVLVHVANFRCCFSPTISPFYSKFVFSCPTRVFRRNPKSTTPTTSQLLNFTVKLNFTSTCTM
jgi:hypothetical protein